MQSPDLGSYYQACPHSATRTIMKLALGRFHKGLGVLTLYIFKKQIMAVGSPKLN